MENKFILGLQEAGIRDIERVGGKNASLGEMIQHLCKLGIRIPWKHISRLLLTISWQIKSVP